MVVNLTFTCLKPFCRLSPPATSASGHYLIRSDSEKSTTTHDRPPPAMVKPLHFKGDKKLKKRKRVAEPEDADAPDSKALTTTTVAGRVEDDDTWVNADAPSDISGPIIIVLPTEPATCLACDANGKVFTSAIENFVDGDSATAEPHDVRQVWVANRVAGTESFSLKGHHGRYIAASPSNREIIANGVA